MLTVKELRDILSGVPDNYTILMEHPENKGRYNFNIEINNKVKYVNLKLE